MTAADHRPEPPPADPPRSALDDSSAPFYTIGQVSTLLGIQPAALRRLDELDIVSPDRSGGGQRRYSRDEVERLREVRELTDEGLTIPGVRKVLALRRRVNDLENELAGLRETDAPDAAEDDRGSITGSGS